MLYTYMESPIGDLLLAGHDNALTLISFTTGSRQRQPQSDWLKTEQPFVAAIQQLNAYFTGELTAFDLSLSPQGTPFQRAVWQALQTIPYGKTISYLELAKQIDKPRAVRAVGAANGANPLPIVIPCHRVIGSNGKLIGFGGGIETKAALLELEQHQCPIAGAQLPLRLD